MLRKSLLALSIAGISVSAIGQEDGMIDEIQVIGQRGMLRSAISRQRNADGVESIITSDSISNLPDQNVAEAVRRLPGVNVLNDQGEGRFISVRGMDPELNSASVNGTRLPSPESDTRAVALDVIPSELVESIQIIKTLTSDMDADTIGASIQINTVNSIGRPNFVKGQALASYNDLNGETSPEYGVDFSRRLNDQFGVAGGFKYSERETSTDNIEMDGWDITDDGVVYADAVEYRDYDVTRERTGVNLSLDFQANDSTALYARTMYSKFDDTEQRRRLVFEMDEEPSSGAASTASFLSDDGEISVRRGLKDRFESQTIRTFELGGETKVNAWTVDYAASWAKSKEHEYRTQDPTRFRNDFDEAGQLGVTFDYSDLAFTSYSITQGQEAFFDPAVFELDKVEEVDGLAEDEEDAFRINLAYDMDFGPGTLTFKTGAKFRQRDKSYGLTLNVLEDYAGAYSLADVQGVQSYGLANISPMPSLGAVRAFNTSNRALFDTVELDFVESTLEDFSVEEDITSYYAMARYEDGDLTLIGGLRVEETDNTLRGNLVDVDAEVAQPLLFDKDYANTLPSLSVKYNLNERMVVRGGIFKSVVRPKLSRLAPKFEINEDLEAVFGNPDLAPYEAWNVDLSWEYYFAESAVAQVGYFYKDIENFIVDKVYEAEDGPYFGMYNGVAFEEAEVSINGDNATVSGVELAYNQAFSTGIILGLNYTYTDSEGDLGDRSIPLPASSESTYNAILGYEQGPLSLRLTVAYRDLYLDELGGSAEEDRYVQDHTQVDFTGSYKVTDNMELFLRLVNLTDEPYLAYQNGPVSKRLLQYEEYSYTARFGIKASF